MKARLAIVGVELECDRLMVVCLSDGTKRPLKKVDLASISAAADGFLP